MRVRILLGHTVDFLIYHIFRQFISFVRTIDWHIEILFFSAQADLTNAALGRSLVCQVHSKDEAGISIILYDTSNSDEDVNINEKIVQIYRPNNGAFNKASSNSSSNTPSRRESPGEFDYGLFVRIGPKY